ncbi:MAG: hypothetical protein AAF297_05450 [Planctomycetota bacterium]
MTTRRTRPVAFAVRVTLTRFAVIESERIAFWGVVFRVMVGSIAVDQLERRLAPLGGLWLDRRLILSGVRRRWARNISVRPSRSGTRPSFEITAIDRPELGAIRIFVHPHRRDRDIDLDRVHESRRERDRLSFDEQQNQGGFAFSG